jgi:hypothetical protein
VGSVRRSFDFAKLRSATFLGLAPVVATFAPRVLRMTFEIKLAKIENNLVLWNGRMRVMVRGVPSIGKARKTLVEPPVNRCSQADHSPEQEKS